MTDGVVSTTDYQKADTLSFFFSPWFNSSHSPLEEKTENTMHGVAQISMSTVQLKKYAIIEVEKASGPDHISAYILKHTAASILPCVTQLFNYSIQIGKLPRQWKVSIVVPITKSTSLSNTGNYRPISLSCKGLEKYVRHLMQEHLQDTSQLSNNQYGFPVSTIYALSTVTHD